MLVRRVRRFPGIERRDVDLELVERRRRCRASPGGRAPHSFGFGVRRRPRIDRRLLHVLLRGQRRDRAGRRDRDDEHGEWKRLHGRTGYANSRFCGKVCRMERGRLNGARRNRVRRSLTALSAVAALLLLAAVFRSAAAGADAADRHGGGRARPETARRAVRLLPRRQRARRLGRPRPDAVDARPDRRGRQAARRVPGGGPSRQGHAEVRPAARRRCRTSPRSCTRRST